VAQRSRCRASRRRAVFARSEIIGVTGRYC
jgi:hypothetical protein